MADEPDRPPSCTTPAASTRWRSTPPPRARPPFDIGKLLPHDRAGRRSTPATATPRRARRRSPTSTVTPASCATAGYPIDQLAESSTFLEVSYLLIYGELPTQAELDAFTNEDQPAHPAARGPQAVLRRLPARRAPHAGAVAARCQRAVDLLPGQPGPVRRRTRSSCPRSGCSPRCRRSRPTPTRSRSGQPFLYPDNSLGPGRELPADDVRLPGRAVRGRPGLRTALDMLFILHADHEQNCSTSTVRLVGSSQANLFASHLGRHQRAVRPAARRREPGRAGDAAAHPRRRGRQRRRVRRAGEEQGERRPADGLRAPGLQELRPAREDRQAERGRDPQEARASPTSCSTSPRRSRSARSPTTTSSSASSTRTSTSTPASSTGRWASRPRCSRSCSRSAGCRAGSPTGAR